MGVASAPRRHDASVTGTSESAAVATSLPGTGRGSGGRRLPAGPPPGAEALPPTATYLAADIVAVTAALVIAHVLRFGFSAEVLPGPDIPYVLIAVLALPVWLGVLTVSGCYDRRILGAGSEEYRRLFNGGVHFLAVVALAQFLLELVIARGFVGVLIPVAVVLTLSARFGLRAWLYRQRRRGRFVRRTLLVGSPSTVVDVGAHLVRADWSGFVVVGACVESAAANVPGTASLTIADTAVPVVGTTADVGRAIEACGADSVAITTESAPGELRQLARTVAWAGVDLLVAPAITDVAGPRTVVRSMAGLPLLHVEEPTFSGPRRLLKDAWDRVGAMLGLALLAPVFVLVALAVVVDSRGPVFFRQTRVGRDGRRFAMIKFRTMVVGAERLQADLEARNDADGVLFKLRTDPRVTRVGRLLRRYSVDELPQLWNVLRGQMSMVGPRPPLPTEVELYEHHVNRRLLVKPGITGLWQVSGRSDLSWEEAVRLDLYYVDHWSPTMDVTIVLKTFSAVMRGSGAY
jgi:exopolysaccharide biosynthesis polyprenyl glycosylphosphotransferase